ncbi:hypothetical protein [Sinorhizobium meliloti]|uniref:hypothetical protein n=1 Tax=Rhizobium meliloti TaxID=382 RepID=UPI001912E319|nr:hypothetical protein [Sinorhizobium meliloti]
MLGVEWPKKSLLYADDSQIQALSVSCRHGEDQPSILIEARPFAEMLDDLELAGKALHTSESMGSYYERDREGEWIDTFRDLVRDEKAQRKSLGDKMYEAYRDMVRWSTQRALLGRSGVDIPVLGWMYGLPAAYRLGSTRRCGPGWLAVPSSGFRSANCRLPAVAHQRSNRTCRPKSPPSRTAGTGSSILS